MISQATVAGVALIVFGFFMVGYGIGWGQCASWRVEEEQGDGQ
jgi:hypothetical protein